MKKYELTTNTIVHNGRTLYQIKALMNFGIIREGDLGGYIESEKNLSQEGNAWVYDNAKVYDNAWVCGDAEVYGDAKVCGNAWVCDDAKVYNNAEVCGDAKVCGDYDYTLIKGFGTEHRNTTFFRCEDGNVRVTCGCFYGTIEEFREQVKRTRTGKIAEEYLMIADLMEFHFREENTNDM